MRPAFTRATLLPWLLLGGVLAVAAWLRLGRLDLVLLQHDEAEWSLGALAIARGQSLPLVGIKSLVGVATGPAFLYLLALPMLVSPDPSFTTGFVGLLNLVGVGLTFAFTRRYFGLLAAVAAALLYATNPWAVYHSRKIWNPDVLPLFSLLFFWGLCLVVVERRRGGLILAAVAAAVAVQLNQSAYVLLLLLLAVVLLGWRRLGWRAPLSALAAALVVSAPYLYYEFAHGWDDLWHALDVGGANAVLDGEALRQALVLAAGWGFPGEIFHIWTAPGESLPDPLAVNLLATALCLLGLAVLAPRLLRRPPWRPGGEPGALALLVLLWLAAPVLALGRHGFEMHIRYLLLTQPAQFVAAGVGLAALAGALPRLLPRPFSPRLAAATALLPALLVGGAQFWQYTTTLALIDRNGLEKSDGVVVAYHQRAFAAAERLSAQFPGEPVYVWGPEPDILTLRYLAAIHDLPIRQASVAHQLLLGPETGRDRLYMLTFSDDALAARLRALGFQELTAEAIPVPGRQTTYRFYRLPAGSRAALEAALPHRGPDLQLTSRFRLLGWDVPAQRPWRGPQPTLAAWLATADPDLAAPDPSWCLSQRLLDAAGRPLASAYGLSEQLSFLRAGDLLLTWTDLPAPADLPLQPAWLSLGMTRCWVGEAATAVDGQGRLVSQDLRLGPFPVGAPALAAADVKPARPADLRLGDEVGFLGYALAGERLPPGEPPRLTLYWQALAVPARDYTVFVQLLREGQLVAQADGYPRGGAYPTSLWQPGQVVPDEYSLTLPAGAPPGEYRLIAGLYTLADLRRLPVADPAGRALGDHLELGTIVVGE